MLLLLMLSLVLGDSAFMTGSLETAKKQAETDGKYILVDVYTDWCGPCKMMDRTTFRNPATVELLKKVVALKVDGEKAEGPELATRYQVGGYPCFLILDAKGKVVDKRMGYMPAQEFNAWLASKANL